MERLEKAYDVYDVDPSDEVNAQFTSQDPAQLAEMFESLREEVARDDCFPLLLKRKDDYAFYILRNKPSPPDRRWLTATLLLLTLASTLVAGAIFAQNYASSTGAAASDASPFEIAYLAQGAVFFALPLVVILGAHRAVQLWLARKDRVDASLPYFIPLPPPLAFMGTLGGIVHLRGPVPTRDAMVRIGALGAIVAFVLSLVVLGAGLALSTTLASPSAATDIGISVGEPLAFTALAKLLGTSDAAQLHPVALAGWAGLFLTGLNLLPLGNLDGGLIARGLLGRSARWLAVVALVALLGLGVLWLPWAVIGIVFALTGLIHPQALNEVTRPSTASWVIGALALAALALAFVPVPIGS